MADPIQYVRQNTDPKIVVSGVVAALAVGVVVYAMKSSGIAPLAAVAKAAGK